MSKYIYDKFSITLSDNDNQYICNTITNITEYDHEIEFETVVPIDGIKRGWVGDFYYHMKGFAIDNENVGVSSVSCLKEVLCARVTVSADAGAPVVWKYAFLKD
ncbi:MAG: hypothetical protein ACI4DK_13385 [Lachnospiraceae bacterium]